DVGRPHLVPAGEQPAREVKAEEAGAAGDRPEHEVTLPPVACSAVRTEGRLLAPSRSARRGATVRATAIEGEEAMKTRIALFTTGAVVALVALAALRSEE